MGARVPAVLSVILALSGCVTADRSPPWDESLGDPQLAMLTQRAYATAGAPTSSPTAGRYRLSSEIAGRYVALRARQTALVLLADREELDKRLLAVAGQGTADDRQSPQPVAATAARLAATRTDQAAARTEIAALRERLAVLTGVAPGTIDNLPGGPIPLPPAPSPPRVGDPHGAAVYDAARIAAAAAQAQAEQARIIATLAEIHARAGKSAPGDVLAADRRALDALLAEQQARAAMAQAYIALAGSSRLGGQGPAR